jgi:phage tail sheath protein FI
MAFQVSPGVNVSEIDLTTIVPAVATSLGGIAGNFEWGPAKKVVLVDSPKMFRETFGDPKNWNYEQWFSATNFLGYSSALQVVRVVGGSDYGGTSAKNSVGGATTTAQLVYNEDYLNGTHTGILARYPGEKGNSLKVSIFPGAGSGTSDASGFTAWTSGTVEYYANFGYGGEGAPESTTNIQLLENANGTTTNDQIHVLVIDEDGLFTGAKNTILERFENLSVFPEARSENGTSIYYKRYINENSEYVYIGGEDPPASAVSDFASQVGSTGTFTIKSGTTYVVDWGNDNASNGTTYRTNGAINTSLTGGIGQTSGALVTAYPASNPDGYNLYEDVESYDVNLLIAGVVTGDSAAYIRDIVEARKDCVAFFSAVNKNEFASETNKVAACTAIKNDVGSSSYCVIDSGYKYQYDPYNDLYRWVPLNADTAGLCARTEYTNDAWFSPAGFNRGQVRNVIKLAFNPSKTFRDQIYPDGINPIITVPGEGTILFGDRTALSKPSAFDRINVRRLFIVLEKAISTASKFSLFEFNDAFTRGRFTSLVTPYLRDVQSRRGIFDFKVVCNESNNTPERIDRNEFHADIYIKPTRSINFIQLNFIATRTDSSFNEFGA